MHCIARAPLPRSPHLGRLRGAPRVQTKPRRPPSPSQTAGSSVCVAGSAPVLPPIPAAAATPRVPNPSGSGLLAPLGPWQGRSPSPNLPVKRRENLPGAQGSPYQAQKKADAGGGEGEKRGGEQGPPPLSQEGGGVLGKVGGGGTQKTPPPHPPPSSNIGVAHCSSRHNICHPYHAHTSIHTATRYLSPILWLPPLLFLTHTCVIHTPIPYLVHTHTDASSAFMDRSPLSRASGAASSASLMRFPPSPLSPPPFTHPVPSLLATT